jgi:hypothetical protein
MPLLVACGARTGLPWPDASAVVDGGDASPEAATCEVVMPSPILGCRGARGLISCTDGGVFGEICPSNDLVTCIDGKPPGVDPCSDLCAMNEYNISCSMPPDVSKLPPGCHDLGGILQGLGFYCCPCSP